MQDDIVQLASKAGFEIVDGELKLYFDGNKALLKPNYMGTVVDGLKEFAAIVAAHEREMIIKQLIELGALADGRFVEAIRARSYPCP